MQNRKKKWMPSDKINWKIKNEQISKQLILREHEKTIKYKDKELRKKKLIIYNLNEDENQTKRFEK